MPFELSHQSLTAYVFSNIPDSSGRFSIPLLAGLAFNLQKQVGDPPDLAKAGFFHPLHQRRVGVGERDFRGAFKGRRTRQGLLQDGLTLRLADLHLPPEDILQKLARPLAGLPFRRGKARARPFGHGPGSASAFLSYRGQAGSQPRVRSGGGTLADFRRLLLRFKSGLRSDLRVTLRWAESRWTFGGHSSETKDRLDSRQGSARLLVGINTVLVRARRLKLVEEGEGYFANFFHRPLLV